MLNNRLTTIAGIMVSLGGVPTAVTLSHAALPLWWNYFQFPLILVGIIGAALLGVAAKGVDEHSTQPQIEVATAKADAKAAEKTGE